MINCRKIGTFFILMLLVLSSGCGARYTFNGKSYSSPKDLFSAHEEYIKDIEQKIKPASSTPNGNAVIITPSKKTCEALGIKRSGHPPKDMINTLGQLSERDFSYFSNYLQKSNLFESIEHFIDDYPLQRAQKINKNYYATVYLDIKSQTQADWFIMVSPENTPKKINFDKPDVHTFDNEKDTLKKIQYWINDVKNNLQGE